MKIFLFALLLIQLHASDWIKTQDSVIDTKNHLEWQDTAMLDEYEEKWAMSKQHCESLKLSNNNDWRLPSKEELIILAKDKVGQKKFSHLSDKVFWTSQEDKDNFINALCIYSGNGHLSSNDKCEVNSVMCVRNN